MKPEKVMLVVSAVVIALGVGIYAVKATGFFKRVGGRVVTNLFEVKCKENEEYVVTQAGGKKLCVKRPKDGGKSCTKSSECETGKCVSKEYYGATSGTCFNSNYHQPCIFWLWTVEESQAREKPATNVIQGPCVY